MILLRYSVSEKAGKVLVGEEDVGSIWYSVMNDCYLANVKIPNADPLYASYTSLAHFSACLRERYGMPVEIAWVR